MSEVYLIGQAADRAVQHLDPYWELVDQLHDNPELFMSDATTVSAEVRALAVTFCQILAFADDNSRSYQFFSTDTNRTKLDRNSDLANFNIDIFSLVFEDQPQWLVIEGSSRPIRISLGLLSGIVVTHPLNSYGASLYRENKLGPHRFQKEHLISGDSFRDADAVFIGGAIDLVSVQDILSLPKLDFQRGREPARLIHTIANSTLRFLPTILEVVDGEFGPTMKVEPAGPLPAIFTSFSGKGTGEELARKVGFLQESRIEFERGDRRYLIDLNLLNSGNIDSKTRQKLLGAWAWFELTANPAGSRSLVQAIKQAIEKIKFREVYDDGEVP